MRTRPVLLQAVDASEAVPTTQILLSGLGLIIGLILASLITQPIGLVLEGTRSGQYIEIGADRRGLSAAGVSGRGFGHHQARRTAGVQCSACVCLKQRRRHKTDSVPKILDTSVIIDGRIAEIFDAGFIEGEIVVPVFVLVELQHIADSSDTLRRQKGRRGLDIINQIKQNERIHFSISDLDYDDVTKSTAS